MMIPKNGITPRYVISAFKRRLWYIVVPFFVLSTGVVTFLIQAPRAYKSSTLILVQPQEIPADYVMSTVTTDPTARLNTLKEQALSRPRLEEIILKYDLYSDVRAQNTMFDAVEGMRKYVDVQVRETRGRNREPGSFEVSFEGNDPVKVRNVTAAIASLFIEDNLRLREMQATGTSDFLERELNRMKEVLRQREELVRKFKEENMGLLPEQMENNHRILAQLQQQLDGINANMQQIEDRKVLLQSQLNRIDSLQPVVASPASQSDARTDLMSLDELRRQLESLRSRYSERHPDVVRLTATIEKREQEHTTASSDAEAPESSRVPQLTEAERVVLSQREDLVTQLRLIDRELHALRGEKEKVQTEVEAYRRRIEEGPRIEQMFVDLRRGYDEAVRNYQSLLEKQLQAKLAENLERTQKGEQFRVLEPANLPHKPHKPDVMKTLAMGFMLALGCGMGLGYLREWMDGAFYDGKELETVVDLPVLICVPEVKTKAECRWDRIKTMGTAGVVVSMASVLFYALFVLWKMDPSVFPIPLG